MQIGIIIALIAIVGFAGYTMKIQAAAHRAGIEECQAKVTAANAELTRQAGELKQEAENHITDMVAAYDAGESQAKTRTVYLQSKGRADVDQHPDVLRNASCTLPASSLRIVNASRAGLRRDPAADVTTEAPPSIVVPEAPAPIAAPKAERRPLGKRQ
jgi:hypothetical protein